VERLSHIITSGFQFNLDSAKRGLLHSVLNEIINGFFLPDFNKVIGTDKENLEPLLAHLCDLPKGAVITLDRAQTIAFQIPTSMRHPPDLWSEIGEMTGWEFFHRE
jgi:hypothetical protein